MTTGQGRATAEPVDPHVQVVRGTPDDMELAALVAGLVAAGAHHDAATPDTDGAARSARARWTALRPRAGALPGRGHDAWRWSLHP
ncbi:acyl-CoA carboxylase subunit epsilon [Cellulomonas sp. zg-ZUI199]|uniref:Acyl-CoA carboxylase subunit epsilon n=1 Tax=Cellulomonas wangleii TaxID=2816956 RepID=A0ABX8D914_9CELL|nr:MULTISPECIES: acyl-CoA carboxylase epsilon subunit [Cellulomonas]MBO0901543.1 acyl-CoA carboxylase subunit epsilon [Cellulomonas sp. zg-ZUI22]MBO0926033.1 acyl-CoA carboxylase subunit epsilon [Cellulomonas wangleii]QVI63325.1 acyl-CoA carboxylase subunit epsilon [Cellulomonas wangleii]